ncbi:MAG TPA: glycoside hydrolase family 127 protein, partial [Flavisolibacter sp.]|nr:glycoside hydrolase family 127 protein [Flavisolibacter sp.]
LFVNLYGGNRLTTKWNDGSPVDVIEQTNYPWTGDISFTVQQMPANISLHLRIPQWAKGAKIFVNGSPLKNAIVEGTYAEVKRKWKKGDVIKLVLPMEAKLMEANPLVEENRNLVAVKRGPIVYCLESADLPKGVDVFAVALSLQNKFALQPVKMGTANLVSLTTIAKETDDKPWANHLYREISSAPAKTFPVRLVPYFAWGNRGHGEMSVWLPVR